MSVRRARLVELLAEPASASAIFLVAPPGYGKTVLLQQYADDERLLYINLSTASTRDALVRELVAATAPRALRSLGTLLDGASARGFEATLTSWLLVRLRAVETTIVLDDLQHVAGDAPSMALLGRLIEGTRSHIRWIVASREMPVLPIGTWLAHSITSLPITERDLSFTREEARELADSLRVRIEDADLELIVEHNAGWPIGIRLALEAWTRFRSAVPLLAETRTYLFAFLQAELWKKLTRVQRELILACALVPTVRPDLLLQAGYANAPRLLASIERSVPFVTKTPDGSYAVHELFRDFVLDAVQQQPGLLARAAADIIRALTGLGQFAEALDVATRSRQPEQIAAVLATGAFALLATGARHEVETAILALPPAQHDSGLVRAIRGMIARGDGNGANAEGLFKAALSTNDLPPVVRLEVALRLGALQMNRGDGASAVALLAPLVDDPAMTPEGRLEAHAQLASAYAVSGRIEDVLGAVAAIEPSLAGIGAELRMRVLRALGFALFYAGDRVKARRLALDTASLATELGHHRDAASAYSVLHAIAAIDDGDSDQIVRYAREISASGERSGDVAMRVFGLHAEYDQAALAGDRAAADRIDAELGGLADTSVLRDQFGVRLSRAILEAGEGNVERAESSLRALPDGTLTPAEVILRTALLALFDLLLERRDEAAAKAGPGLLAEVSRDSVSQRHTALAHGFRSLALWMLDRPAQASRALATMSAIALPPREQLIIDAIRQVTQLTHPIAGPESLAAACAPLRSAGLGGYANLISRVAGHDKSDIELTPAEVQLLRTFYEQGGRTADVAALLQKSPYTVRNQIRSAIAKIGCAGRNEAIVYARRRGWF